VVTPGLASGGCCRLGGSTPSRTCWGVASGTPRGRLVIFGTSAGPAGTIQLKSLYRSALRILGYGGLRDSDEVPSAALAKALGALADGRLDVATGKVLPLDQVNQAFDLLAAHMVRGQGGPQPALIALA
jgi:NADPH:quinone reductase-like Zn-dependent oxidoreductase